MKLSVWQQFSSNHSADFTVVGVFKTIEEAQKASTILREELVKIASWFENPKNRDYLETQDDDPGDYDDRKPLPPEQTLHDKYKTGFSYAPIDWLWYSDEAEDAVRRFENIVFISNYPTTFRTWSGEEPFEKLMEAVGGVLGGDCMILTCTARDTEHAQNMYDMIVKAQSDRTQYPFVPRLTLEGWIKPNTRPDSKVIKLILYNEGEFWDDLKQLRKLLTGFGCTDLKFEVFPDCEDIK